MDKWISKMFGVVLLSGFIIGVTPIALAQGLTGHRVRKVYLKSDDVAVVRTALGIATLIQVPDRPTSVVIGDTSAFKVEYLESAITIKPVRRSARSNLYIYTDYRRYDVSLVTVSPSAADYIVYLDDPIDRPTVHHVPKEYWRRYRSARYSHGLKVQIQRLGVSGSLLMAEFSISAINKHNKHNMKFAPGSIWLTQSGRTVPIQNLSLTGVELIPGTPINGLLTVERRDIPSSVASLRLEVRAPVKIFLPLPEARLWMK